MDCQIGADFQQQFPSTTMNASDVLTGLKEYISPGSTVFIATNERNHSSFSSIAQFYDVIFLEDFSELLTSISKSISVIQVPPHPLSHPNCHQFQRFQLFSTNRADSGEPRTCIHWNLLLYLFCLHHSLERLL